MSNMDINMNGDKQIISADDTATSYQCDTFESCIGRTFAGTKDKIRCWGESSCGGITSNVPESVLCYGRESCQSMTEEQFTKRLFKKFNGNKPKHYAENETKMKAHT